jgi:RND family efflux transporter MFP subunit
MSYRKTLVVVPLLAIALSACSKDPSKSADANKDKAAGPALLLAAEDVHTVHANALASGPSITGSVQPERNADLRAEVSTVVLKLVKDNGDQVRRGDLLMRLDDTAIRDSLASAEAASRAASQAFDQAERQFQRMKTLRGSGMASAQQLEDAEIRRNNAQSDLEGAKTRVVQARQQLARTEIRAPFDGVVSDRKVSAGDTVQIGKELVKVIDPASMRFEGLVSADQIGNVKAGQNVSFRINGYGEQEFTGKVRRVNPSANATTRQVEVLVDFTGKNQPKLAGLYAEGRVETETSSALMIPATALIKEGDKASTWRVKDNTVQKVAVEVSQRDPRSGNYVLKAGLADGDMLLRQPSSALKDGQKVEMAGANAPTKAAINTVEK